MSRSLVVSRSIMGMPLCGSIKVIWPLYTHSKGGKSLVSCVLKVRLEIIEEVFSGRGQYTLFKSLTTVNGRFKSTVSCHVKIYRSIKKYCGHTDGDVTTFILTQKKVLGKSSCFLKVKLEFIDEKIYCNNIRQYLKIGWCTYNAQFVLCISFPGNQV